METQKGVNEARARGRARLAAYLLSEAQKELAQREADFSEAATALANVTGEVVDDDELIAEAKEAFGADS